MGVNIVMKFVFALVFIIFPLSSIAKQVATITLSTHNLCPYGCFNNSQYTGDANTSNFRGVAVDLVRCSLDKMKIPLELKVLPWKRAESAVKTGVIDGFFAASRNPVRDSFGVMSAPIADQKWQWFLLRNSKLDPSQHDFKDKAAVAGFIGSNMLYWLKQNGFNVVSQTVNTEGLFNILMRGRVDAIIANNYVMDQILTLNKAVDRVKIVTVKSKPLGVYFSKFYIEENPLFIEKFNHNITICRRE